ncbi:MAG: HEAT repeat domain-containing protein, partial [Candidatus Omnitrophota bacterium]
MQKLEQLDEKIWDIDFLEPDEFGAATRPLVDSFARLSALQNNEDWREALLGVKTRSGIKIDDINRAIHEMMSILSDYSQFQSITLTSAGEEGPSLDIEASKKIAGGEEAHAFTARSGKMAGWISAVLAGLSAVGAAVIFSIDPGSMVCSLWYVVCFGVGIYLGAAAVRYYFLGRATYDALADWGIISEKVSTTPIATSDGFPPHPAFYNLPEKAQHFINIHESFKSHFIGMLAILPFANLFVGVKKRKEPERASIAETLSTLTDRKEIESKIMELISRGDVGSLRELLKSENRLLQESTRELIELFASRPEQQPIRALLRATGKIVLLSIIGILSVSSAFAGDSVTASAGIFSFELIFIMFLAFFVVDLLSDFGIRGGPQRPSQKEIKRLISKLEDKDTRAKTISGLVIIGRPAVQLLIMALKNKTKSVRLGAVEVLSRIGDPVATEPLLDALNEKDGVFRKIIAEALLEINDSATLEAKFGEYYEQVLRGYILVGEEKWTQAVALGESAFPALEAGVKTGKVSQRKSAAGALGKVKGDKAVQALIELLRSSKNRSVRGVAALALGETGDPRAAKELGEAMQEGWCVYKTLAEALVRLGTDEAVSILADAMKHKTGESNTTYDRRSLAAAEALGKIGGKKAIEALSGYLYIKDWKRQEAAANALGEIGTPDAFKVLEEATRSESGVRIYAANALAKAKQPSAVPVFRDLLARSRFATERKDAVNGLGKAGVPEAVPALVRTLKFELDPWVRTAAVKALGNIDHTKAIDGLIVALRDKNADIRWTTAEILLRVEDKTILAAKFGKNYEEALKAYVVISRSRDAGRVEFNVSSIPALVAALRDEDDRIRDSAVRVFGQNIKRIMDDEELLREIKAADPHLAVLDMIRRESPEVFEVHPELDEIKEEAAALDVVNNVSFSSHLGHIVLSDEFPRKKAESLKDEVEKIIKCMPDELIEELRFDMSFEGVRFRIKYDPSSQKSKVVRSERALTIFIGKELFEAGETRWDKTVTWDSELRDILVEAVINLILSDYDKLKEASRTNENAYFKIENIRALLN